MDISVNEAGKTSPNKNKDSVELEGRGDSHSYLSDSTGLAVAARIT